MFATLVFADFSEAEKGGGNVDSFDAIGIDNSGILRGGGVLVAEDFLGVECFGERGFLRRLILREGEGQGEWKGEEEFLHGDGR